MSDDKLLGAVVTAYWYDISQDIVALRLKLTTGELIDVRMLGAGPFIDVRNVQMVSTNG